jgi:tetratricopeptide (TPR) repeat protein
MKKLLKNSIYILGCISIFACLIFADSSTNNNSSQQHAKNKVSDIAILKQDIQKGKQYSDILRQAWNAYYTGNNPKAQKLFQQVLDSKNANEPECVQSLFGIGINFGYALHRDHEKARFSFQHIINEYPLNPAAPWALLELAYLSGTDTPEQRKTARKYYHNIFKKYPESIATHEAALRLASTYFFEIDPKLNSKAVETLENHLKKYPDNPLASIMRFRLTYWYEEVLRDYGKGLEHALILGELKMADPYRWPMQYWNIAQMYRIKFNKPLEAIKWYQKIIDECPRDYLVFAAKQYVKELSEELESNTKNIK